MPRYILDLACGHQRQFTYRKKPPFLEPSETSWSLSWCTTCEHSQKVLDLRHSDGGGQSKTLGNSALIDGQVEPQAGGDSVGA